MSRLSLRLHCPRARPGRVEAIFAGPDPDPLIFISEQIVFSNAVVLIFWLTFMYLLNISINYYLFTMKIEPLDLH